MKDQQKRLQRVKAFWRNNQTSESLRVSAVCLQLTDHAMRKVSKNPTGDPISVELSRGDIQAAAGRSFVEILPFVPYDPLLPPTAAVTAMLGTLGNIVARLSVYEQYPTALWK
eukprot:4001952-Pyramimonas_sp.AAC.1